MTCLVLIANYELVPKITVALYASYATLPNVNFRHFASTQSSHRDTNCVTITVQTQNSAQLLIFFPWLHTPNRSISSRIPSSLPIPMPYFQPTFARRPNGHCPGTFRAINFFFCLSPVIAIGVVPFYFRPCFFSLPLSPPPLPRCL